MIVRELILAVQFLTRLPTPQVRDFRAEDLTRSARWFPLVGLLIGAALLLPLWALEARPWLAAVLALLAWVWITGALHLDGLGDVADALGAAHRSPERFLEVLKDPHLGVFGVVAIVMQLLLKVVLLAELAGSPWLCGIVLVPAWCRWATLLWSRTLPPLQAGMAERFAWQLGIWPLLLWAPLLGALSLWLAPPLLLALLLAPLGIAYWRRRLGGISGDCLGASTEVMETLLLLALVAGTLLLR
ncbi:adenosylcobinamide-GDP ribazoletransferase [Flavobacterium sp. MXW15]|uniref:Adenosylcobinamide-GDP ribazoletransferase n=1 Tax=Xanthomonas chitinilytica TaxID=2989819 RepID=A0ABT3JSV8_9XANT|nr:adenosylcobinamide-GDP ribazoletransferase [Xanthomonas sp. H13-6]MCW4454334.1 adenosylcobinamide-GDP ribazoletransferase [Flavobacterium sp. MXW15]MCW4471566.1 adenosylcobinamide-GDP ribazoletransferase [Xanthomonas sp. H13-6]